MTEDELIRTTVSISRSDKELLESVSKLSGSSVSVLIRELVRSAVPTLKSTLEAFIEAQNSKEKALSMLSSIIDDAEKQAREMKIDCEVERRLVEQKKKKAGSE